MKRLIALTVAMILALSMIEFQGGTAAAEQEIEVPFDEYSYFYIDGDGYNLQQTLKISPWISEKDPDLLAAAWKEVGKNRVFPDKGSMGITNGRVHGSRTFFINYDEIMYCVGSLMVENLTPGFHLSSTDTLTAEFFIGEAQYGMVMQVLYSNSEENYYSRLDQGGCFFQPGAIPIRAKMVSDKWGPVPFVIALPIDRTPNHPDGSPSIYDCTFYFGDDEFTLYQYDWDEATMYNYYDGVDDYRPDEEEVAAYAGKWVLRDDPDTHLDFYTDEYRNIVVDVTIKGYGKYCCLEDFWTDKHTLYMTNEEKMSECTLKFSVDQLDLEFLTEYDDDFYLKVFSFVRDTSNEKVQGKTPEPEKISKGYDPTGIVVVSMGDSYSAGEGIPPFYGQNTTDRVHNNDWLAHRSENSWHGLLEFAGLDGRLALHRGELSKDGRRVAKEGNWYFVASSGAETTDFYRRQEKKYNVEIDGVIEKTESLPPQLSVFSALKENGQQVDYVLMTLGGNDLGFADVLARALGGKILDAYDIWSFITKFNPMLNVGEMVEEAKQNYQSSIRSRLKMVYTDVWEATDRKATIIIAGYPKLFGNDLKGLPASINKGDVRIINDAVVWFNKEIMELVEECRLENPDMKIVFVGVTDEFRGYEAYSHDNENEEYLNRYILGMPMPQDLNLGLPFSAYSMHPNKKGAQAYARAVQRQINSLSRETASINVGNTVFLGSFEQDNNAFNGPETIEWIVLDVNVDKVLLLSKYGLEVLPYNTTDTSSVTWYGSRVREWLNYDFWESAFTPAEQAAILTTTVDNSASQGNDAIGGENTQDKLFLLSYRDSITYGNHLCAPTAYALGKGAWVSFYSGQVDGNNPGLWWLRSPSKWASSAELMYGDDLVPFVVSFKNACVRPAMWVDKEYLLANQ